MQLAFINIEGRDKNGNTIYSINLRFIQKVIISNNQKSNDSLYETSLSISPAPFLADP